MAKPGQRCSGFVLFGKGEEIQMKNMRILTAGESCGIYTEVPGRGRQGAFAGAVYG